MEPKAEQPKANMIRGWFHRARLSRTEPTMSSGGASTSSVEPKLSQGNFAESNGRNALT
jgi:hypothetical protein